MVRAILSDSQVGLNLNIGFFFVGVRRGGCRIASISKMAPLTPAYNTFLFHWLEGDCHHSLDGWIWKVNLRHVSLRFLRQLLPWRQCWWVAMMTPSLCLVDHGSPGFPEKGTDQMFHTYTGKKMWFACLKLGEEENKTKRLQSLQAF